MFVEFPFLNMGIITEILRLRAYIDHPGENPASQDILDLALILDDVETFRRLRYDGVPFDVLRLAAEAPKCLEEFLRRPGQNRLYELHTGMPRDAPYRAVVQRTRPFGQVSDAYMPVTQGIGSSARRATPRLPVHLLGRFRAFWPKETDRP